MTPSDIVTIQAFTAILPQLEAAMSAELKQAVHQVGRELRNHQPEAAADTIRYLVAHHPCLQDPFRNAYEHIQEHHRVQAQAGVRMISVTEQEERETGLGLEAIAVPILTAENFSEAAKEVLSHMRHEVRRLSEGTQAFLLWLQRSVSDLDEQATTVLKAMEQQLLTVEDLAYALGMPFDQARRMVEMLWHRGYIDSAKSGVINRAITAFIQPTRRQPPADSSTHFVLTTKGHFYLHPLLFTKRPKGVVE